MDCAASYGELAVLANIAIDPVPLRHDVLTDRQADAAPPSVAAPRSRFRSRFAQWLCTRPEN
jgi:hypothetical protein